MSIVITGDLTGFTKLKDTSRRKLTEQTKKLFAIWQEHPGYAEIFRGDSFQLLFSDVETALKRMIQIRCWFIKSSPDQQKPVLDAKMAIGLGAVDYIGTTVHDSDGEAFHLSGRSFDALDGEKLKIITANTELNRQLDVITNLMNLVIESWTTGQAAVIFEIIENKTQQQIAKELGIGQSAVNNRIRLSKWKSIEQTINYLIDTLKSYN
ncbi:hypothetical protein GS399_14320 [Pedobacter sp. HMF7647]|uniref:Winged helix-turn-helix transcriptional regulator n=1 Tax=Hufsiella arboris TaxID=2695275 RepID=A0A7K1YCI6_9SPHI|nr:hypothetical protein [Hufsiella arboris]MXV52150.1 hypothetical protein [Hufsiella arboris]